MNRRRVLLLGSVVVVVGVAAAWLVWPRTAITRDSVAKIKDGMALAEVEMILGGAARDESTGPVQCDENDGWVEREHQKIDAINAALDDAVRCGRAVKMYQWLSDSVCVVVWADQRVVAFTVSPMCRWPPEDGLTKLRRWLRL